jgi:hypothetical protein
VPDNAVVCGEGWGGPSATQTTGNTKQDALSANSALWSGGAGQACTALQSITLKRYRQAYVVPRGVY